MTIRGDEADTTRLALEADAARSAAILDACPVPMAMNDEAQRITFLNRAFVETFGYDRSDLGTLEDWWPRAYPDPAYRQRIAEEWAAELEWARRTSSPFRPREAVIRIRKDGTRRTTLVTAASLARSFAGNHLVVLYDISARIEAEVARHESEAQHRAILHTAMDGFWLADQDARLLEVNETYCRMSGYAADELLAMRIPDLEAVESAEETARRVTQLRANGAGRFETRHRRKDGSTFDVEVSVQFRPVDGGRMVAFLRDITERKRVEAERARLEEQLRQAQKMESVGRLAGGVAHDFNNMLGAILGHVELGLEQVGSADPLRDDLEQIRKAAQRSAQLTRQLLAFARKQTVSPKVIDVNEAVSGTLRLLTRLIGEDIQLVFQPGAELWPVRVDPGQIDQALANLCVNARDAIADVGTITLETENVALDAASAARHDGCEPGAYVRLSVRDDGCGMSRETLEHVFEPFYTTKGAGQGTGLGLATVYGMVRQNRGYVDVRSEVGVGTTFDLFLPRHVGEAREAEPTRPSEPVPGGDETILLVEDEAAVLSLTARMLRASGYQVLTASSPAEAMRAAEAHAGEIHLLVTDVVMPTMNGRDLAARLGEMRPRLRNLFMSGYTANVIAHHNVLDEGVNFIQKPFTRFSLAAKVRAVLGAPG